MNMYSDSRKNLMEKMNRIITKTDKTAISFVRIMDFYSIFLLFFSFRKIGINSIMLYMCIRIGYGIAVYFLYKQIECKVFIMYNCGLSQVRIWLYIIGRLIFEHVICGVVLGIMKVILITLT